MVLQYSVAAIDTDMNRRVCGAQVLFGSYMY
jgi:hypothetical protein